MSDEYVEEACFYLSELKLSFEEIAKQMNLTPEQAKVAVSQYKKRISKGSATFEEDSKQFWAKILKENSGDEKITLVDDKGRYYHGWKSEIEKLGTEELVELLVVNKSYSDKHPLSEFSKTQPVVGYDPLMPLRNIRRTVSMIDEILQKRVDEDDAKPEKKKK
ncbi:MAG: hypothetical protein ACYC7D_10660 [Nitrososphaerales archaeon]